MRWSSLTRREGLVLIEANFKTGSLRKKSRHFPTPRLAFPLPHLFTPLQHDIPGTSPDIPDQTSALVLVENLLHPSLFFTTFRQFVWLAFVHARSSPSTSTGLVTTLESRASPGTSPETGRASASHWRPLWEGRPTSEVQGACWPWRR